jgi:hypothetical protein
MKQTQLLLLFSFSILLAINPEPSLSQGVAAASLGLEGTALIDGYGLAQNPATLALYKKSEIGIQHFNRFRIGNWNDIAIYGITNTGRQTVLSAGYTMQGFPGYQTHSILLGGGIKCGKRMSVGLATGIAATSIIEQSQKNNIGIEGKAGITYAINSKLLFGLTVNNPQDLLKDLSENNSNVSSGLKYCPSSVFVCCIEIIQSAEKANAGIGIEYKPAEKIACRVGFHGASRQSSIGIGFNYSRLIINVAVLNHPYLGLSTGLSLSYCIKKTDE